MRFKSKRTIPGKSKKIFKLLFLLFILFTFLLIIAGAAHSIYLFLNYGPATIKSRLTHVLKMDVELGKVSISYPNVISLHSLNIKKQGASLFKSKRIDCHFTWKIIQGKIQFNDIAFVDAFMIISRQADTFNFSRPAVSKFFKRLSDNPPKGSYTFNPAQWPVTFDLKTLHFQNSQLHLTDDKKEIPSLNGLFDLDLVFSKTINAVYPQQGTLLIKKGAFSHNGLSGNIQGSVDFVKNLATPSLSINLPIDNSIKLHGAIRDYLTNPVCKFALDGYQVDFSFFDSLLFPFMPPQTNIKIKGEMEFTDSTLYNTIIPSLEGTFTFDNGRWSFDPVNIELSDNRGIISGWLILDAAVSDPLRSWDKELNNYGKINFVFNGSSLPMNPVLESLHRFTDKITSPELPSLNVELGVLNQQGKLYISSTSINSDHGALILEGKTNLQFTELDMSGTYIIPVELTSITKRTASSNIKVLDNDIIVPVKITGSLLNPEIIVPSKIKPQNKQNPSKAKKLKIIRPQGKKKKKR